jgi:hypothetical protein
MLLVLRVLTLVGCTQRGAWDIFTELESPDPPGSPASSLITLTIYASQDSYIDEDEANSNYGGCDTLTTNQNGLTPLGSKRALLLFDLSGLPAGATIDSAELFLTKVSGSTTGVLLNVHRVLQAWDEGAGLCGGNATEVDWWTRTSSFSWAANGGDYDTAVLASVTVSTDQEYSWSSPALTALAAQWFTGSTPNHGLILGSPDNTGSDNQVFGARNNPAFADRPRLVVGFRIP